MRGTISLDNRPPLVSQSASVLSWRVPPRGSVYAWKEPSKTPRGHFYQEGTRETNEEEMYSDILTKSLSAKSEKSVRLDVDGYVIKKALASFHPETVPYIKKWFSSATTQEKQAMGKLFNVLASQPNTTNENKYRPTYSAGRHLSYQETRDSCMDTHFPTLNYSEPKHPVTATPVLPTPGKKLASTKERLIRPRVNRPLPVSDFNSPFRTEFDIAPDWRQPRYRTVPVLHRTLYGKSRKPPALQPTWRRDFSIHPHWGLN